MAERPDYDALAQDINLKDITSCEHNAILLRKIRDGDPFLNKRLYIVNEDEEADSNDFVVAEGDDLGWLGYFVGKSEVIEELYIYYLPEGGDEINRFASALGRMHQNSLKHLFMHDTGIGDEGIADIVTALRLQSQLKCLQLYSNDIGRDGCIAIGNTLSRWPHSNNLEVLNLHNNVIDDGGLQALVSGMMNCRSLKKLHLPHNRSITADGLRSLSPLFQSESHSLEILSLYGINFGDDGAIALAEGLRGNIFLEELAFNVETAGITNIGWSAFSTLLCDTSTINCTFLSNHTLTRIGDCNNEGTPRRISTHLALNKYRDAAIYKILKSHPDLDMEPFFEWKMKFLPSVMSWLQRARSRPGHGNPWGRESTKCCQSRKLSALYKFVRAMPDLTTIGYWEGRMIHIEAERLRLADEMRRLDDEEDITRKRLGMSGQPMDEASARNKRMRLE